MRETAEMTREQTAWLADAGISLEPAAARRFSKVWSDLHVRYPNERDGSVREAALTAAARYLAGEIGPVEIGKTLARARAKADETMAAARQIAVMAVDDGAAEATTARDVGVDRMALRKWRGLR